MLGLALALAWPTLAVAAPRQGARTETTKAAPRAFVAVKPAPATQTQKSAKDRGINPCLTPDPGWGVYRPWDRGVSLGQALLPGRGGVTKSGQFDVIVHFHGHEAARKEWVRVMDGAVLVGIDLGIGSGAYSSTFANPQAFERLIGSVEELVAKRTGKPNAKARHIGITSWSAGYGAVGEILSQPYGKRVVESVVLLDGLHSGYEGTSLNAAQLAPFVEYARRAAQGKAFMFVSHSSIIPPGYASTTETANYLIHAVGGAPKKVHGKGPMGMDLIARYTKGNFHVRGYAGNDKMDHCAHFGVLRDVLKVRLKPRLKSPKGYAAKPTQPPKVDSGAAKRKVEAATQPALLARP